MFEIESKTDNRFLARGRIWIDAEDFAITRVEGVPAQNPSLWIRHVDVVQHYQRVGKFWLAAMNRSHAEAKVFGASDVEIDYFDYVENERHVEARQQASAGRP